MRNEDEVKQRHMVDELLWEGMQSLLKKDEVAESTKVNTLRGGSSGLYLKEGDVAIGTCPRRARLRMEGVKVEEITPNKKLMFQAGQTNEDSFVEVLKESWPGILLQEEEVPVKALTRGGTPITGRPDVVLCSKEGVPQLGIELKLACSLWTARDVLFEGRPKMEHMIQAAFYSWQLGVPYQLWYVNRVNYATNEISTKLCPKKGTWGGQWVQYSAQQLVTSKRPKEVTLANGQVAQMQNTYWKNIPDEKLPLGEDGEPLPGYRWNPKAVTPFQIGYQLSWNAQGQLTFIRTDMGEEGEATVTPITRDRIQSYYELVDRMPATDELGPIPKNVKGDGSKASWTWCDYCPLQSYCTSFKTRPTYKKWRAGVESALQEQEE